MLYHGNEFEHDGHTFRVAMHDDDDAGMPWENSDFHGPVSDWTRRAKLPGEMVLCKDGSSSRYYDFAEAVRIARKDGWDAQPFNEGQETRGQQAHKAAMSDYDNLRRFCSGYWNYIGVTVELLDDDGDTMGETESLSGIESDAGEYLETVAHELADEILARLGRQLAA